MPAKNPRPRKPAPPAPPPAFKTIWLLVGSTKQRPAPWGECVEVE